MSAVPENCVECGCCCFSTAPDAIRVTGEDYSRLGERVVDHVHFIGHRAFMKLEDGHCAALQVDTEHGRYCCEVYEQRPGVCRELAQGSPQCAAERHHKGERLVRLRTSVKK